MVVCQVFVFQMPRGQNNLRHTNYHKFHSHSTHFFLILMVYPLVSLEAFMMIFCYLSFLSPPYNFHSYHVLYHIIDPGLPRPYTLALPTNNEESMTFTSTGNSTKLAYYVMTLFCILQMMLYGYTFVFNLLI